jgi:hypothetical protein
VNTFFNEKRNRAFGVGATITGLGPIFLPQLITILLGIYGSQGTTLIIGGIAMNILAAALLLRPVKWHKKVVDEVSQAEKDSLYKPTFSITQGTNSRETLSEDENEYLETCPIYHDVDSQSIYGFDVIQKPLQKSSEVLWKDRKTNQAISSHSHPCFILVSYKFQPPKSSTAENSSSVQNVRQRSGSADFSAASEDSSLKKKRWFESDSIASINLESSLKLFHEEERPMSRVSSRHKMFDNEKRFLSRKASLLKMNLSSRRNTVG